MHRLKLVIGIAISLGIVAGPWLVKGSESNHEAQPVAVSSQPVASAAPDQNLGSQPQQFAQRRPRYLLQPGDTLDLDFPLSPEFNQTLTIAPDGYITLRGVGGLFVKGSTVPDLTQSLTHAYRKILHDPVINVQIRDFQKPFFIAGGQVGHPGKYDLREDITVSEAIAIAGGLTPKSKSSEVLLFRRSSPGFVEVKKVDLKKIIRAGNFQEDSYLRPGDMLFVPQNAISRIERFLPTSSLSLYFNPIP
ncbi:MAG TPA: polysaccharide biosynthesis/export family protein [Terriglobia bacterium]|nr:polysaccharide biosynthesis/export family protein [Terriglobia bacterium]